MSTVVRPSKSGSKKRLSDGLDPTSALDSEGKPTIVHPADYIEPHDIEDDGHLEEEQSFTHRMVILGAVVFPLLGMIGAIALAFSNGYISWLHLTMLIGGWYATGLGVTIGFHRMLTHRSFEAHPWARNFWTILGSLAVEGSPIDWCMVHRKHHQFSDHHGDPHSPHLHDDTMIGMLKGAWHSHVGWMFNANWSRKERLKYVPDLNERSDSIVDRPQLLLMGDSDIGHSNHHWRTGFDEPDGCLVRFVVGWIGSGLPVASHDLGDQFDLPPVWCSRLQVIR